jgi:hypothetical protein
VDDSVLVHDAVVFGEGRVFAKSRYPEHALLWLDTTSPAVRATLPLQFSTQGGRR